MRSTPCGRLFLFYSQYSISPAGIQDFDAENLCGFAALQTGNSIGSRPSAVQQRESACGFFPLYGVRHILKTQSKAIYKPSYMSSACVFTAWQTGRNIGDRPSAVQQRESACGFFPLYGVRHILKTQPKAIYKLAYMSSDCVFTALQTGLTYPRQLEAG